MSFGKLSSGCIVLGYVLQVEEKHLLVSLPGGFTGIVPYQEVSDVIHDSVATNANNSKSTTPALSSLVKPHQIVRCYILGQAEKANSKKKTITLSMRSSLVNKGLAMKHFIPGFPITGCIASKEDHGYVVFYFDCISNALVSDTPLLLVFLPSMDSCCLRTSLLLREK